MGAVEITKRRESLARSRHIERRVPQAAGMGCRGENQGEIHQNRRESGRHVHEAARSGDFRIPSQSNLLVLKCVTTMRFPVISRSDIKPEAMVSTRLEFERAFRLCRGIVHALIVPGVWAYLFIISHCDTGWVQSASALCPLEPSHRNRRTPSS